MTLLRTGARRQTTTVQDGQKSGSPADRRIESLASPGNLTRLGVQLTDVLNRWRHSQNQLVVCFHSLSTLLHYVDTADAFQFLNTLKGHLIAADAITHIHVEPDAHEEQTINQFRPLFDGIVDMTDLATRAEGESQ